MFLKNLLYGLILGIGFIIPGVSGGVLAIILGIYDNIIYRINNFFKDINNNFRYLFSLIIGIVISIILFSKIILYFLENHSIFISYLFIGLILGGIPYLSKEIKKKSNKNIAIIPFILSFIIGVIIFIISKNNYSYEEITIFKMIIAGFFYAIGKIVPGISGSLLLMLLHVYNYFLNILANPFTINLALIKFLIPFFISFLISLIIILKLIQYLLINHFRTTYSSIIGFIISSSLFLYPNYFSLTYLIVAIFSFLISYSLGK